LSTDSIATLHSEDPVGNVLKWILLAVIFATFTILAGSIAQGVGFHR
jgi:hypothetical protein